MPGILKSLSKFNTILLFAAFATLSLFYAMQLLIMQEEIIPAYGPARIISDITLPRLEIIVDRETPKPVKPDDPPDIPDRLKVDHPDGAPAVSWQPTVPDNPPVDVTGEFFLGPADGDAVPIAQIQPVYPSSALERGVEGFVIVEFDVSEAGAVVNPRVLGAQPPGIFDRAALQAISRWKYKPKVIDGRVVKMTGLQTRFSFTIRE